METTIRSESLVRFESFELNLRTGELYRNGLRLKLRGHPVDVLAILLEHPGELITRETLRKRLWPDNTFVDFEQILNNSIGKLREALGDRADSPRFVETLPRLGYRFIAPVEKSSANSETPENPQRAAQLTPTSETNPVMPAAIAQSRVHRISKHWILGPAIALAVVLAAFGIWYLRAPSPAPRITHYEELTLDGRQKNAIGTDGVNIYLDIQVPRSVAQVPVSGGKVTVNPIDLRPPAALSGLGISPDGSSMLIMNRVATPEPGDLWVVDAVGRRAHYLARAFAGTWSPDGRTVAYANAHGDIYTIGVHGGESQLLYRADTPANQVTRTLDMSWSPDGKTIRLSRWGGKIFEISSTGANFHEWLPGWNMGVRKCCGHWTPDGRLFLFLAGRTLGTGSPLHPRALGQIWGFDERHRRLRRPVSAPTLLAAEPLLWGNPVPSRDGKTIFARGVSLHGELERYDPTSKRLEPYLGGISAEMPAFSRDGKYVAYVSFPDGILWRANRDGSGLVQLTEPPFYPRMPHWSPDGTQILFTDNTQNGIDAIYVVSFQGGPPKRLLPDDGGPQSLADWSPDGTKVVYDIHSRFSFMPLDEAKYQTRIFELKTGKIATLPKRPGGFWSPLWSPNGRYLAGHSIDNRELVIFDLETGTWKAFPFPQPGSTGYHNWSHDSRFVYLMCWILDSRGGVYRVSVPAGKAELVFERPEGFRGTGLSGFWMSLDPTDAPLLLRDVGTDEIYALTLEVK